MSDFKDFLNKVLAPIRADATTPPAQMILASDVELQTPKQAVADDELERRYVEVMNALIADAHGHNAMNVFTDVVTWKLAVVAYHWGPRAAGDVMRKLGGHLGTLAEAADAQREADASKEAGHRPSIRSSLIGRRGTTCMPSLASTRARAQTTHARPCRTCSKGSSSVMTVARCRPGT